MRGVQDSEAMLAVNRYFIVDFVVAKVLALLSELKAHTTSRRAFAS